MYKIYIQNKKENVISSNSDILTKNSIQILYKNKYFIILDGKNYAICIILYILHEELILSNKTGLYIGDIGEKKK